MRFPLILAALATLVVGCTMPDAPHVTYQNPIVFIGSGTIVGGGITLRLDGGDQSITATTSATVSPSTTVTPFRP